MLINICTLYVIFLFPFQRYIPTSEFSETPLPSKMSKPLTILPTFGVGGKDASMNGNDNSSYIGDLLRGGYSFSISMSMSDDSGFFFLK